MKQFVEFVFDDSLGHAHVNFITKFFDSGVLTPSSGANEMTIAK